MIVGLGFTSCEKDAGPPPPPPPVDTTDTPPPVDTTTVPPVDTTETTGGIKFAVKTNAFVEDLDSIVIDQYISGIKINTLVLHPNDINFSEPTLKFTSDDLINGNNMEEDGYYTMIIHLNTTDSQGCPETLYGPYNIGSVLFRFEFGTTTYDAINHYFTFTTTTYDSDINGEMFGGQEY